MSDIHLKCPHCQATLKIDAVYFRPPFNDPKNQERIIVGCEHDGHKITVPETGESISGAAQGEGEAYILITKPVLRAFIPRFLGAIVLSFIFMFLVSVMDNIISPYYAFLLICGTTLLNIIYERLLSEYKLSTQRLFIRKGIFSVKYDELEVFRIKDVTFTQNIGQRIFRVGNITIYSTDDTTPELHMRHIPNPAFVKEKIRLITKQSRKDEKVLTAEFIQS